MSLLSLPNELLLQIVTDLRPSIPSQYALLRTNRRLANLLLPDTLLTTLIQTQNKFFGWRALHHFASYRDLPRVRFLLDAGVGTTVAPDGTLLNRWVGDHPISVIQTFLEAGVSANDYDPVTQQTPLLHAVSAGRTDIVKLLLAYEGEVDVNYMDPYGNTGLSISASLGNLEIVQDLLAHPKIAYPHGASLARHPLHLAVESGSLDVFRLLLSHTAPDSDGSVDVNVVSWAHRTPLLVAAEHGREGIVKFLLGYPHLDVNFVVHGWSALHMAVNNGRESVVRLLVDEPRTNLNLGDLDGWTPLHMAARPGHVEIVKILLAKRCKDGKGAVDVWQENEEGISVGYLAGIGSYIREVNEAVKDCVEWGREGRSDRKMRRVLGCELRLGNPKRDGYDMGSSW